MTFCACMALVNLLFKFRSYTASCLLICDPHLGSKEPVEGWYLFFFRILAINVLRSSSIRSISRSIGRPSLLHTCRVLFEHLSPKYVGFALGVLVIDPYSRPSRTTYYGLITFYAATI
jgi:hypothetical protein